MSSSAVSAADRLAFQESHPALAVSWSVPVNGTVYPWDVETLDLNNVPMDNTFELEDALAFFPKLKTVEMCECGISNEDMDALNQRWPDIRFIWTVHFAGYTLRTDATYFCASMDGLNHPYLTNYDAYVFRYLTDMQALDLGHMYITDISFLQYMPHMTYLIIAECNIEDYTPLAYCKELKYLEAFQTIINVGMCLGITPVIGITLPFFSYGGSSMVTMFAAMGLVSGVKYKLKPKLFSIY